MELNFLHAFFLTIFLETTILFLLCFKKYNLGTIILNGIIASSVTLPFVWFFFPIFGLAYDLQLILSENFAVLIEAFIYLKMFPKIQLRNAFFLSLACNFISFSVGIFLNDFIPLHAFPIS